MNRTPPIPLNEAERLQVLRQLCLLDTPADPAFDGLTALAAQTFDAPIALVSLIDERRQWFKSRVGLGPQETPREQAFCAYAIHRPEPLVVLDARLDERFVDNPLVTGAPHIRFYAGAPLITREGMSLGTLCIIDTEPRAEFGDRERSMLQHIAALVLTRIETLNTIGYVDPLTRLPNRTRFIEDIGLWIADAGHAPENVVAAVIDVCGSAYHGDMVKALGHAHVEAFIVAAKDRLLAALPPAATAYRIAGTRFGLLFELPVATALAPSLEALAAAYRVPLELQGVPHAAEPSVGVMRLSPQAAANDVLRSLLSTADAVREQGRGWGEYERGRDDAHRRAFHLLTALPQALAAADQLSLHYQPRVDLASGECVGVEALLRWRHPQWGPVAPSEFIPLAERTALMGRITRWVLEQALRQAACWQRAGHCFSVAINVSAIDLDQADFVDDLCLRLAQHAVDPRLIELEFTESALSLHADRLEEQLQRIRGLGLQLAIDDFGTGYANLNYLKRIPATTLKIDQSFIRSMLSDARDRAIVPTMIRLGHDLGQRVVAEGIESDEIYQLLLACGCDEGQGYVIARPMPVGQFEGWLAASAGAGAGASVKRKLAP